MLLETFTESQNKTNEKDALVVVHIYIDINANSFLYNIEPCRLNFSKPEKDFIKSLTLKRDSPNVLNYLAYSWLERDYKIDEAFQMLEKAYSEKSNDPYIIDSIGWAYYLIDNYVEAEKYLKRAVELMPEDPTVNDHYGDILWKLNRKIQARYFWNNVLSLEDADEDIIKNINIKMIEGISNS